MKRRFFGFVLMAAAIFFPSLASAHCQIPCGIFDDSLQFIVLSEDITTIEKSISQLAVLAGAAEKDYNQIVRWVTNKDDHADKFMAVVSDYFLAQRIKPVPPADTAYGLYVKKVTVLHQMLVTAMKCKQSTEMENVTRLRQLTAEFKDLYL